ncbi:hypothetical protein JW859_13620 [bacterium]|nr:hypothetical protein [bacterium]
MLENLPRGVLIAGAALLLFALLLGARWILLPQERGAVSVEAVYDDLGVALDQAGLLPLTDEDAVLMAYANLKLATGQLSEPQHVAGGKVTTQLGQVLRTEGTEGSIRELWAYPQYWRELKPGELREQLRVLMKLDLAKQAAAGKHGSGPGGTSSNFYFVVTVNNTNYRITPFFVGDSLDALRVVLDQ